MRRALPCWSSRLAIVSLWLLSSSARADLIDPAEEACGKAGEPCTVDGRDGTCVEQTCSKLDYGNMGPGGTPGTKDYPCVRCELGAEPPEAEPTPKPADEPAPTPTPTPTPTDENAAPEPAPKGGPEPAPENTTTAKGTRCAVGPSTSMMSLALGLGLLGLAVRRRR